MVDCSRNDLKLVEKLIAGKPLAFRRREDGSLVVIGGDGRKFNFSSSEVAAAEADRQMQRSKKKGGGHESGAE